jgi:4-amino-4-deoxy-L-arabinose transferase-like glycosyltransferase
MNAELFLIPLILLFSLALFILDRKLGVYVLLVASVLLHKQLFSVYQWNLLSVRIVMLGFLVWACGTVSLQAFKQKSLKSLWQPLKEPFTLLLILLWIVRAFSLFFTKNLPASLNLLAFFTTMVALGIFLYIFLKDNPKQVLSYIKFYIYTVFALCLFAYFQAYLYLSTGKIIGALWNVPDKFPRLGSRFCGLNNICGLFEALLPVLGALILSSKKWKPAFAQALMFLPMVGVLLFTNSRTSWILALVAFFSFISILFFKKFGSKGVVIIVLLFTIFSAGLFIEYQNKESAFRREIKDYFHYRIDSFDAHFMLLTGAIEIFNKYPVLGGGYGGFFEHFSDTKVAAEYFGRDPAAFTTRVPAHTIWGEVLSETGLLGLTTFILFISLILGSLLYLAFKSDSKEQTLLSSAMFSSILGWLVAGIFYSYNSEFFFLILFLYFMYAVSSLGKDYSVNQVLSYFKQKLDLGFLFIALLSLILVFISLGKNHLIPWDEAIYAGIAKNMVATGKYFVMEWIPGKVWFEKPPLLMWIMAGFMNLFGISELVARLPSAIFGFSTILLVYIWAKKMFGKGVAFISALALLTSVHYLYYARASMMDVSATFFITLGLYFYYLAKQRKVSLLWVFSGLSIGLAVMTKGVVGLLPLPIIGIYELYLLLFSQQKLSPTLIKNYILLILYAFVVIMPWHLYMHLKFGIDFWNNYIGYHVLDRALSAIEDKGRPFFWYFVVMKVSMRIWFVVLIPAFFYGVVKALKKNKDYVFLLIWGIFIFLFFSIAKSKLVWYITPIYPVAVILVGVFLRDGIIWVLKFFVTLPSLKKSSFSSLKNFFGPVLSEKSVSPVAYFLSYFALATFGLAYFYFNKGMVYTSDLTGPQATLLELKDSKYGTDKKVYADRIELPLVLFYTNGPYEIVDFSPLRQALKDTGDNEDAIFITKESRFGKLQEEFPRLVLVSQEGNWVLGYLPVKPVEIIPLSVATPIQ